MLMGIRIIKGRYLKSRNRTQAVYRYLIVSCDLAATTSLFNSVIVQVMIILSSNLLVSVTNEHGRVGTKMTMKTKAIYVVITIVIFTT